MTHRQLVALCSCPCRRSNGGSAAGFQILGFHPVDRDPAIMKNGLPPGLGLRRSRRGLREAVIGVSGYSLARVSGCSPSQGAGLGT